MGNFEQMRWYQGMKKFKAGAIRTTPSNKERVETKIRFYGAKLIENQLIFHYIRE